MFLSGSIANKVSELIMIDLKLSPFYHHIGKLYNQILTQHSQTVKNTWNLKKMKLTYFKARIIHVFETWFLCE